MNKNIREKSDYTATDEIEGITKEYITNLKRLISKDGGSFTINIYDNGWFLYEDYFDGYEVSKDKLDEDLISIKEASATLGIPIIVLKKWSTDNDHIHFKIFEKIGADTFVDQKKLKKIYNDRFNTVKKRLTQITGEYPDFQEESFVKAIALTSLTFVNTVSNTIKQSEFGPLFSGEPYK